MEEEEVRPLCPYILEERRLPRLPEVLVVATMRLLVDQVTAGEEEAQEVPSSAAEPPNTAAREAITPPSKRSQPTAALPAVHGNGTRPLAVCG